MEDTSISDNSVGSLSGLEEIGSSGNPVEYWSGMKDRQEMGSSGD